MQRTFNYTGRKKIEKSQALFSISRKEGDASFDVVFSLNARDYPSDASLYVEAYFKETRQRYSYGSISNIMPPKDRRLIDIDFSGTTLFRVLVVDESSNHGMILAKGEAFRADSDDEQENRESLLSIKKMPLGQLPWKVELETGSLPELCINSSIPNCLDKLKVDPHFQSLIFPAAFREILFQLLWREIDEDDEIVRKWLEFSSNFAEGKPDSEDPDELIGWVDTVVAGFVQRFDMCDHLVNAMLEDE